MSTWPPVTHQDVADRLAEAVTRQAGSTSLAAASVLYNVKDFGAKVDFRAVTDAAMTSGSATLTSATAAFTAADVGKWFKVTGAGASGIPLYGTISAYTNATTVTLSVTAGTTVTGKRAWFCTDDTTALQAAIDAASAAGGGRVMIPGGGTIGNLTLKRGVHFSGMGVATRLYAKPGTSTPVIGSPTDGTTYLYEAQISDMTIHGNKELGCTGDGIFLAHNTQVIGDLDAIISYWDPQFRVTNVNVLWCGRDGVRLDQATTSGAGSSRSGADTLQGVFVQGSKRYGFHIRRYDCFLLNCSAGMSGSHGFMLDCANAKLANCKSWYSGVDIWPNGDTRSFTNTLSAGIYLGTGATGNQISGSESQDDYGYGIQITGTSSNLVKGYSCGGNSQAGILLSGGANGNDIDMTMVKADNPAGLYGAVFDGSTTQGNRVRLGIGAYGDSVTGAGSRLFHFQNGALPTANELDWAYANALSIYGDVSGSVSFFPFSASRFTIRMIGNTSIAAMSAGDAYPGQQITVVATQDGTGNRTLTWDASYKGAPALAGAGLTANKVSTFQFVNVSNSDTPSWVYTGGVQGL